MEAKEAYEKLRISDEERKSVQSFLGYKQARANLVLDLEPYTVASLENDETFETYYQVEDLFDDIDMLRDVYSVMVKKETTVPELLYRYVSDEECRFFSGKTKKCVLVLDKNGIEKALEENSSSSVITYKIHGVLPLIDSLEFASESKTGGRKTILPPFAKIKKFEYESTVDGIKYYDIELEKGDLSNFDDSLDKKEELKQFIRDNFDGFREFINNAKKNPKAIFDSAYDKAFKFKAAVYKLAGIMCREKELEIMMAKEVCLAEDEKRAESLSLLAAEEKRISMVHGMQNRISYVPGKTDEFCKGIDKLNDLLEMENNYIYYASKLKIPFSRKINPGVIKSRIEKIKGAVRQMAARVSEIQIPNEVSVDEARSIVSTIQDDLRLIESLHLDITGIDYLPHIFEENINVALKEQIDKRAFEIIKKVKIQKYRDDLSKIPEKPSLWTRITGRAKLQSLQRENLRQKIELEKLTTHSPKRTYSIVDTLSDIESEQILLGNVQSAELDSLKMDILSIFDTDREAVEMMTEEKVGRKRNLPENVNAKKFRRRKEIKLLTETNEFLGNLIGLQRDIIQRKTRAQGGLKVAETFLSDKEMFDKVDEMLKTIEAKTVDILRAQGIEDIGLGKDTVRGNVQKKDGRTVMITDDPTIRLFDD